MPPWESVSTLNSLPSMKLSMRTLPLLEYCSASLKASSSPSRSLTFLTPRLAEESQGKVQISNASFTEDTISCKVNGMDVTMRVVEREEPMKCVKLVADNSPIPATIWVQLLPKEAYQTKCRVTFEVDIPFFLKPMVGKKLDGAADQLAEMLTKIPY